MAGTRPHGLLRYVFATLRDLLGCPHVRYVNTTRYLRIATTHFMHCSTFCLSTPLRGAGLTNWSRNRGLCAMLSNNHSRPSTGTHVSFSFTRLHQGFLSIRSSRNFCHGVLNTAFRQKSPNNHSSVHICRAFFTNPCTILQNYGMLNRILVCRNLLPLTYSPLPCVVVLK
jgi:hypothetical protein